MSSSKLSERAWRMLEAGDDIESVHARTQLSIAVLTGMMHDIADWDRQLTSLHERVSAMSEPRAERRLIGVCPTCLPETRTPILADPDTQYAVCPACGEFLTLRDVRAAYLTSAGVLHITRTQGAAAKWIRHNLRVHVTGRDLMNARQQGRIHPRHIEGRYWEWDLTDLLAVANRKQTREEH